MSKQGIISRLMALPGEIAMQENRIIDRQVLIQVTKTELANVEAELLTSGKIDGKNAEQRAAQLKQATIEEREAVAYGETELARERAALNLLQNEFAALKAVAGMMREVA